MASGMLQKPTDKWLKVQEKLRSLVRLPVIMLLIFTSCMAAWLGMWAVWRLCEFVFHEYLSESWVG